MTLYVLMTPDCQVVCYHEGQFLTRFLSGAGAGAGVVHATRRGGRWYLRRSERGESLWYDPALQLWDALPPSVGLEADSCGSAMLVLRHGADYLSDDWSGMLLFRHVERSEAMVFQPVPSDDFALLCSAAASCWVCGPEGSIARLDMMRSTFDAMQFGKVTIGFSQLMEALRQAAHTGEVILSEVWKVWRFVRFNPLVVLDAFGEMAMQELEIQLSSLVVPGGYEHDLFILTDHPRDVVEDSIARSGLRARTRVLAKGQGERLASVHARACLMADPAMLEGYAPILFCGGGVVFDGDVTELLGRGALAYQIETVDMRFHPGVESVSANGQEVQALPSEAFGRVLLVPSMVSLHHAALEAAFMVMERCVAHYDESVLPKEPYVIFNDALQRVNDMGVSLIGNAVQMATEGIPRPWEAVGMACFLPGVERVEAMRHYLEVVRTWH